MTKSELFLVTVFTRLFQSDECLRELDIDDSIPCSCVHTLEDAFSKVTNVIENSHSTFRFPVTVFTPFSKNDECSMPRGLKKTVFPHAVCTRVSTSDECSMPRGLKHYIPTCCVHTICAQSSKSAECSR